MSDLRLKRIEIRNWMTVRSTHVEFPEKGLVHVLGSNLAAQGKLQSIGAGKTALGEALSRALLGVTGRYTNLGYYLPDGMRDGMYIKVEAQFLEKPFTVEMGFRSPEMVGDGEALRFQHGDVEPIQAARAVQTRAQLEKMLRITPELANWTVFIDGDRLKFNRLSQDDSVSLLMTALAQPPWTEYQEQANFKLQSAKRQTELSQQVLTTAHEDEVIAASELRQALAEHAAAEADYQRQVNELKQKIATFKSQVASDKTAINGAEKQMSAIKKKLKKLEESKAEQNQKWEIERQNLRDDLALLEQDWQTAMHQRASDETNVLNAEDTLEEMEAVPKNCPKCGKPWDKAHSIQALAKVKKEIESLTMKFEATDKVFVEKDRKRKEIKNKISNLEGTMREAGRVAEVQDLCDEHEALQKTVRSTSAMMNQRELTIARLEQGIDKSFVNKKFAVGEERERRVAEVKETVEKAASNLLLDQDTLKVVQYWHKAYGPTGIPNMILSDAVPLLNRIAQRISGVMTGGVLQVSYSTTRQLASGSTRSQLITKVTNHIGSKRLEGGSKGEGSLSNLVIAENLNEVGQVSRRIGYRWYDEVNWGHDGVVRKNFFNYLREIAHRQGILIFIVDHHPEVANYADYVLVAEKSKERGTVYYWR